MDRSVTRPADSYSPIYFLASLGAGGIAVSFFMFLMFWVHIPVKPSRCSRISPLPLRPVVCRCKPQLPLR